MPDRATAAHVSKPAEPLRNIWTKPSLAATIRAGLIAGIVGGIGVWIYELIVWVQLLGLTTSYGVVEGTAVLSFGPGIRAIGFGAFLLGLAIHFAAAMVWGVLFAVIWPWLRARNVEATLAALFYGVFVWIVMHNVMLALFSPAPPQYTVYSVINGFMSHLAFAVPLALVVKRLLAEDSRA